MVMVAIGTHGDGGDGNHENGETKSIFNNS
jgi:hypothetical protein